MTQPNTRPAKRPAMIRSQADAMRCQPEDKPYKVAAGEGLFLWITSAGGRSWNFKYQLAGKERRLVFGPLSDQLTYKGACKRRDWAKEHLRERRDPRNESFEGGARAAGKTLEAVAREWWALNKGGWKNQNDRDERIRSLENHVFPSLGHRLIGDITRGDVVTCLQAIAGRGKIGRAHEMRARLSIVFGFAEDMEYSQGDPARPFRRTAGALPPRPKRKGMAALTELRPLLEFLRQVDALQRSPIAKLALRFAALTGCRAAEVTGMTWDEIWDAEDICTDRPGRKVWRLEGKRMKNGLEFLVPLSPQAMAILAAVHPLSRTGRHVFPKETEVGRRDARALHTNQLSDLCKLVGYKGRQTTHGLRASFSTIMNTRRPDLRQAIDLCLAHAKRDQVEGRYNRATHLAARFDLMDEWGRLLDRDKVTLFSVVAA